MTWDDVGEGTRADAASTVLDVSTWSSAWICDAERDVRGRDDDVSRSSAHLVAGRRRLPLAAARGCPTKATMARKTPMSRTSRFERFKLILPESDVTGGTTVAPA